MFARRSIQRALDSLATSLRTDQLEALVRRLHADTVREQVAAEWEAIVLSAFVRCSRLQHESDCGGAARPDVRASFADIDLECVADICTVSDADIEDDNPIELLQQEVLRTARDLGWNGAGLSIHADSLKSRNRQQRKILALPAKSFVPDFVREHVRPFLRLVAETREVDREFRHDAGEVQIQIEYRASETNITGGGWQMYTFPRSATHNPVYRALEEKSRQLRRSGFSGVKGVLLCDGGCDSLAPKKLEEIVHAFFRQHRKTVGFIAVLDIPDTHGTPVPPFVRTPPRMRVFWNPHQANLPSAALSEALERVLRALPRALRASQYFRRRQLEPDLPYHNSFEGAFMVERSPADPMVVRISARAALQALSGDLREYPDVGQIPDGRYSIPVVLLKSLIAQGRTIRDIRLERLPDEDDDWIVLELGTDPAVSPFTVPGPTD